MNQADSTTAQSQSSDGSELKLPYKLYTLQKAYATDIRKTVEKDNGILLVEAGTGFGKTLANLYGSLKAKENGNRDHIIYLSKTHQQNGQIMHELRKINEVNDELAYYAVQLASRSQLCHIKDVKEAPYNRIATELCQQHRKDRKKIRLYSECQSIIKRAKKEKFRVSVPLISDLDDLRNLRETYGGCAYLTARDLIPSMDIIVGHYYYFLSSNIRDAAGLPEENVTLILDEGHNLEDVCCSLMSRRINNYTLERADEELKLARHQVIKKVLESLQKFFDAIPNFLKDDLQIPLSSSKFIETIEQYGLNPSLIRDFQFEYSILRDNLIKKLKKKYKKDVYQTNLDRIAAFLEIIYYSPNDYGIVIEKQPQARGSYVKLSLECLNPALLFNNVKKVANSIIICSGTLSPLPLTAELLGIKEQAKLKAWGSVIDPTNVKIHLVPDAPSGNRLSTSYRYRQNSIVYQDYQEAILRIAHQIAGGTLVFFPSYSLMDKVDLPYTERGLRIYTEARKARENKLILEDYKTQIDNTGQAVLAGVFGGKLAEGADFPGDYARAVIICGIPYAPIKDPLITLKRSFYDSLRLGLGDEWYKAEAFRKVAQGLGRAWRGKQDYAIAFLLDDRFQYSVHKKGLLPEWLRTRITISRNWDHLDLQIDSFFGLQHDKP